MFVPSSFHVRFMFVSLGTKKKRTWKQHGANIMYANITVWTVSPMFFRDVPLRISINFLIFAPFALLWAAFREI